MKENTFPGLLAIFAALGLPDLKDNATVDDAVLAIKALKERVEKAETKYNDLASHVVEMEVEEILNDAISARKITKELFEQLKADYAEKPQELRALVAKMPVQELLSDKLKAGNIPEHLQGKTFQDLYISGDLEQVRRDFPELYEKLRNNS